MKKLSKKGKIHPSPQIHQSDHLSLLGNLPAAIFALIAALSPEDREVLAYLISSSGNNSKQKSLSFRKREHPPLFTCNCFRCYKSFWVRWDSSPNRQAIHEILEAVESRGAPGRDAGEAADRGAGGGEGEEAEKGLGEEGEVGSVRRLVSYIGERFWGVWAP